MLRRAAGSASKQSASSPSTFASSALSSGKRGASGSPWRMAAVTTGFTLLAAAGILGYTATRSFASNAAPLSSAPDNKIELLKRANLLPLLHDDPPQLDELGIPLYGILHENVGDEAKAFSPYLKGKLFYNTDRTMFPRKLSALSLFSFATLKGYFYDNAGTPDSFTGDGTLLGAVYVVGKGTQGVLWEHKEEFAGDTKYDLQEIVDAVKTISSSPSSL